MDLREHADAPRDESVVTVNYRIEPLGPGDSRSAGAEPIPHRLGRFRVLAEIARGGMGVVLHAYDADLDRELAVKLLSPGISPESAAGRRFAQEARVVSRLVHPGIIPVFDAGALPDGRSYFAMPFVPGETLATHLDRRPDPSADLSRWLQVFEQVCRTMAYAHAQGVAHRDLKPGNVMIGKLGVVFVMDWGVAACTDPVDRGDVGGSGGWVFGTPAYMAPEQARGRTDTFDPRCDVFGLGAILCEILTGQPPYVGPDVAAVTRLAADGDQAETVRRLNQCRVARELMDLVRRCLARDPADRPADAREVAHAIGAHLRSAESTPAPSSERGRGRTWHRWAELVTAALALTASAAVGVAAHGFKVRAVDRPGSPAAVKGLTPTVSPPARP